MKVTQEVNFGSFRTVETASVRACSSGKPVRQVDQKLARGSRGNAALLGERVHYSSMRWEARRRQGNNAARSGPLQRNGSGRGLEMGREKNYEDMVVSGEREREKLSKEEKLREFDTRVFNIEGGLNLVYENRKREGELEGNTVYWELKKDSSGRRREFIGFHCVI